MKNEGNSEEEKFIQSKKSILNTLNDQKKAGKEFLIIVEEILSYWKNELEKVGSQDKEREAKLKKLIKQEESTIKKIIKDIIRINEIIDQIKLLNP